MNYFVIESSSILSNILLFVINSVIYENLSRLREPQTIAVNPRDHHISVNSHSLAILATKHSAFLAAETTSFFFLSTRGDVGNHYKK